MKGYKGFYKTINNLVVCDSFSQHRTIGQRYVLDDSREIKYGGDAGGYYSEGWGFHFADSISKTMPHFSTAISLDNYVVAEIEAFGEIVESRKEKGCYAARGYQIDRILTHDDIVENIIANVNFMESVRILGIYNCRLSDEDKNRILKAYYKLFKKFSENFERNWKSIYYLYEGIMHLKSDYEYEYFNADSKKEYAKIIIDKVSKSFVS